MYIYLRSFLKLHFPCCGNIIVWTLCYISYKNIFTLYTFNHFKQTQNVCILYRFMTMVWRVWNPSITPKEHTRWYNYWNSPISVDEIAFKLIDCNFATIFPGVAGWCGVISLYELVISDCKRINTFPNGDVMINVLNGKLLFISFRKTLNNNFLEMHLFICHRLGKSFWGFIMM